MTAFENLLKEVNELFTGVEGTRKSIKSSGYESLANTRARYKNVLREVPGAEQYYNEAFSGFEKVDEALKVSLTEFDSWRSGVGVGGSGASGIAGSGRGAAPGNSTKESSSPGVLPTPTDRTVAGRNNRRADMKQDLIENSVDPAVLKAVSALAGLASVALLAKKLLDAKDESEAREIVQQILSELDKVQRKLREALQEKIKEAGLKEKLEKAISKVLEFLKKVKDSFKNCYHTAAEYLKKIPELAKPFVDLLDETLVHTVPLIKFFKPILPPILALTAPQLLFLVTPTFFGKSLLDCALFAWDNKEIYSSYKEKLEGLDEYEEFLGPDKQAQSERREQLERQARREAMRSVVAATSSFAWDLSKDASSVLGILKPVVAAAEFKFLGVLSAEDVVSSTMGLAETWDTVTWNKVFNDAREEAYHRAKVDEINKIGADKAEAQELTRQRKKEFLEGRRKSWRKFFKSAMDTGATVFPLLNDTLEQISPPAFQEWARPSSFELPDGFKAAATKFGNASIPAETEGLKFLATVSKFFHNHSVTHNIGKVFFKVGDFIGAWSDAFIEPFDWPRKDKKKKSQ